MAWRGLFALGLGFGWACLGFGQLTDRELQGLEDTLYLANFNLDDLRTNRTPFREMALSDWVRDGMGNPVEQSAHLMAAHRLGLTGDFAKVFAEIVRSATGYGMPDALAEGSIPGQSTVPEPLLGALMPLAKTMADADAVIREELAKLTPAEQRLLIESLPTLAIGQPSVKLSFVREKTATAEEALALLQKIDLSRFLRAGIAVQVEAYATSTRLKALNLNTIGKSRYLINGLPIVVGGVGGDLHDELDARITIDLGGDDVYRGRHGAGVGYSGVLIDLGGNDDYRVPDLSVGSAVLGVGVALDLGGEDKFSGSALNFGSGIGGVGILIKSGGDDVYKLTVGGQGFAMFGVGILSDTGGDDLYKIGIMGQGAGRTQSLGWLIDRAGDDVYQAGGMVLNQPLFDDVYYSQAQGFGMGFRDDAGGVPGGVGMLTDGAGTDNYLGETYCQAASYWFGLGSLYDATGNDSYRAHHYAQSSAMHLTSAYLFDLAGADGYLTQYGAAQAIGHDYGLAFFLDRQGNDVYASRDARPGTGVSNGIGIFMDSAGIDRYATVPGFGRGARSMMSLGLFVELEGEDLYPEDMADGAALVENGVVIRNDLTEPRLIVSENPPRTVVPGSKPEPSVVELNRLYDVACGWRVGSSQGAVDDAIYELIAIGMPAFNWMVTNKLATVNRLEVRAWARIANGIGIDAVAALGRKVLSGSDKEIEAVIRIGSEGNIQDIGALLPNIISTKPELRDLAIRTAGTLKARGAAQVILPVLFNADDYTKRIAMAALADIGDPNSVGTAANYVKSPDPFVRDAAIRLVLTNPQQAETLGKVLLDDTDERLARIGVTILSRLNMFNSLEAVGKALSDPRPGVRISALLELNGRCPAAYREAFVALLKDPIPSVARVARQVRP